MALRADAAPSCRVLALAALLVAMDVLLFALIAEDVLDGGGLVSHDRAVLAWFVDHRTDRLIAAARWVSTLGGFASLLVLALALGVWLWHRGWHGLLASAALISLLLASLASTAAKALFDRPRPPVALHATTVTLAAFPSGHTADAAAFFLAGAATLAITVARHRWSQGVLIATGVLLAALVGISRLVLAVHWLSDVVAGYALGSSVAVTVVVTAWYVAALHSPRRRGAAPRRGRTTHALCPPVVPPGTAPSQPSFGTATV